PNHRRESRGLSQPQWRRLMPRPLSAPLDCGQPTSQSSAGAVDNLGRMDQENNLLITKGPSTPLQLVGQPDVVLVAEGDEISRAPGGRLQEVRRVPQIGLVAVNENRKRG